MNSNKIVVISAPSGSGKTTIVKALSQKYSQLSFSVSATTRHKRVGEIHGKDYYFLGEQEFKQKLANNMFVETQMVYEGVQYGTLVEELDRIWEENKIPLLEIDVQGALEIERQDLGCQILSIYIEPPSIEVLKKRLEKRGTESEYSLAQRIKKAQKELLEKAKFDHCITNSNLEKCINEVSNIVDKFVEKN